MRTGKISEERKKNSEWKRALSFSPGSGEPSGGERRVAPQAAGVTRCAECLAKWINFFFFINSKKKN
jgi:hypothetical protein